MVSGEQAADGLGADPDAAGQFCLAQSEFSAPVLDRVNDTVDVLDAAARDLVGVGDIWFFEALSEVPLCPGRWSRRRSFPGKRNKYVTSEHPRATTHFHQRSEVSQ